MSYPIPKITYDPGTGVITLPFTFPPVGKAGAPNLTAQRTDSFSISGLKQVVYQRTDEILPVQMDFVPLSDMPQWTAFIRFALAGGEFNYYPDATAAHWTTYTLDDTDWSPARAFYSISKFTLHLRKVVGSDQTGS
jgi:hypothetical protein